VDPDIEATLGNLVAMPSHTRRHIDDLYRLGRIGHVRGSIPKLNELELVDAATKPFAIQLRKLVANFDLKKLHAGARGDAQPCLSIQHIAIPFWWSTTHRTRSGY